MKLTVLQIGVSRSATAVIIEVGVRTSSLAGSCAPFAVVRSEQRGESTASRAPLMAPVSQLAITAFHFISFPEFRRQPYKGKSIEHNTIYAYMDTKGSPLT